VSRPGRGETRKGRAAAREGRLFRLVAVTVAIAANATASFAQDSAAARSEAEDQAAPRSVSGRVVRPGADGVIPVPGAWVTLHRVGPDSSGPLDSVRTNASGRYAFRYQPVGRDAVYFASSMFGGVAYFTPPLPPSDAGGDAAEITVFDTTSATLPIRTRGRHLVVGSSAPTGRRTIVEVFELSNDTTVTAVSGPRARATWSTAVTPNAADFQVGQNDIGANSVALRDGRVLVFASLSPGIRQVAFSYSVPASDFPLTVPVADSIGVFEVLLEDAGATVAGGGLAEQESVTLEGRTFRRFLAQDVPPTATVTIDVGDPTAPRGNRFVIALVLGAAAIMVLALAFALTRRRQMAVSHDVTAPPVEAPTDAASLARAIADLDEAFARTASPTDAERDAYRERRAALKTRLTAALAKEEVPA
jgi:hypothetical protein